MRAGLGVPGPFQRVLSHHDGWYGATGKIKSTKATKEKRITKKELIPPLRVPQVPYALVGGGEGKERLIKDLKRKAKGEKFNQ